MTPPNITDLLGKNLGKTLSISTGALLLVLYVHSDAKQEIGKAEKRSMDYAIGLYEPVMRELKEIKEAIIRIEKRTYDNKR